MAAKDLWPDGVPSFGDEIRKEFFLDPKYSACNPGSYGTTPKVVMNERISHLMEIEQQPDLWYRSTERKKYDTAVERIAAFLGVENHHEIAFVSNTTAACNAILSSLKYDPEDMILCTSHIYQAVLNAADFIVTKYNADLLVIDATTPIESEDYFISCFEQALALKKSIRLAIIDHVSSASAILFPVKRLCKILHDHGVLVLVDGAHGPGQVEFSIPDLDCDFYMASLHKWCYAPKGCGILWVKSEYLDMVRPQVVSHCYKTSFCDEFYMQGTTDLTRYTALPKALDFYASIGGRKAIFDYVDPLLEWAVDLLCNALKTKRQQIPESMRAPYMRVLEFPDLSFEDGVAASHPHANDLCKELLDYNVVACLMHLEGRYWLRIAANVYSTKNDFIKLKDALLKFIEDKRSEKNGP